MVGRIVDRNGPLSRDYEDAMRGVRGGGSDRAAGAVRGSGPDGLLRDDQEGESGDQDDGRERDTEQLVPRNELAFHRLWASPIRAQETVLRPRERDSTPETGSRRRPLATAQVYYS